MILPFRRQPCYYCWLASVLLLRTAIIITPGLPAAGAVLTSWARGSSSSRAAAAADTADHVEAAITTNAPVLRWHSGIVPGGTGLGATTVVALRVNVSRRGGGSTGDEQIWSSGEVRTNLLGSWLGLAVYEGPGLSPGTHYTWSAEERIIAYSNGTVPAAEAAAAPAAGFSEAAPHFTGSFITSIRLPAARSEAATVMSSSNMSALWNGSWHSVQDRIRPSGFLPTSVSGGYGGITQMFVRDASGQIIGLAQCGPSQARVAGSALRFMLTQLRQNYHRGPSFLSYAPHVMQANQALTKIVSFDEIDQTDDTFYLIAAYGYYCEITNDTAMRSEFYALLRNYTLHYLAPGARSLGKGGTPSHPKAGGHVLYWNSSLSLLWNPNLEHSRLGSYWSCYDTLTNVFAAEGLRVLAVAAHALGEPADAAMWTELRAKILRGIDTALTYADPLNTAGGEIYGELRGHENGFSEDKEVVGYSPLLWGLSYENYVPVVLGLSAIGHGSGTASAEELQSLGLNEAKLDRTWTTYRQLANFQWVNSDPENSAWVSMTHVNSSGFTDPPAPYGSPPPPVTVCNADKWKVGEDALSLASGPDVKHIAVGNASQCCAACAGYVRPNKGRSAGCGAWFFNGESGVCYLKSHAHPDNVTKPSPLFAAGYGSYSADSWCSFTGNYHSPPMQGCPVHNGKSCACASTAVIGI
jgi:hypothetical protein